MNNYDMYYIILYYYSILIDADLNDIYLWKVT